MNETKGVVSFYMSNKEKSKINPPKNPNKRDCVARNITFQSQVELEKLARLLIKQ